MESMLGRIAGHVRKATPKPARPSDVDERPPPDLSSNCTDAEAGVENSSLGNVNSVGEIAKVELLQSEEQAWSQDWLSAAVVVMDYEAAENSDLAVGQGQR